MLLLCQRRVTYGSATRPNDHTHASAPVCAVVVLVLHFSPVSSIAGWMIMSFGANPTVFSSGPTMQWTCLSLIDCHYIVGPGIHHPLIVMTCVGVWLVMTHIAPIFSLRSNSTTVVVDHNFPKSQKRCSGCHLPLGVCQMSLSQVAAYIVNRFIMQSVLLCNRSICSFALMWHLIFENIMSFLMLQCSLVRPFRLRLYNSGWNIGSLSLRFTAMNIIMVRNTIWYS